MKLKCLHFCDAATKDRVGRWSIENITDSVVAPSVPFTLIGSSLFMLFEANTSQLEKSHSIIVTLAFIGGEIVARTAFLEIVVCPFEQDNQLLFTFVSSGQIGEILFPHVGEYVWEVSIDGVLQEYTASLYFEIESPAHGKFRTVVDEDS